MERTDYDKQASDFLSTTKTTFQVVRVGHGKYFPDDKETRDIYEITLTRGGKKPFVFRFGQSVRDSGTLDKAYELTEHAKRCGDWMPKDKNFARKRRAPDAYSVLACLTKYDPGTFENFCAEFGYDEDSRKALETYLAVQKEFSEVCRLWNAEEREALSEIN